MLKYIIKRLIQLIPILFGLSFAVFMLMYFAPGDAATKKLLADGVVGRDVIENVRNELGLNKGFLASYAEWIVGVLRGDLGVSHKDSKPVLGKILEALRYTAILSFISLLLSLLISIPLGILSAIYRDGIFDHIIKVLSFISNALPNFLISILLIYIFCIKIKIFPVVAKPDLKGLLLPAVSLSLPLAGRFIRQIRSEILSELSRDYIEGLRARGLKGRYIFINILHNLLPALLTITGLSLGTLLGGSVVTETIFSWPGIGALVMGAISARDYPLIQGFVLISASIYVLINLVTDISYTLIDPRIDFD